jgi:hypothetical protein
LALLDTGAQISLILEETVKVAGLSLAIGNELELKSFDSNIFTKSNKHTDIIISLVNKNETYGIQPIVVSNLPDLKYKGKLSKISRIIQTSVSYKIKKGMETESNNLTPYSKIKEVFNSNENNKIEKKKTETNSLTVEYFNKTEKVLDNGRYQVSLPLNQTMFPPANTFQVALKRFYITEKSFDKDTIEAEKYRAFVNKFT